MLLEIFAIRWFLGVFESAMLPGVVSSNTLILPVKTSIDGPGFLSFDVLQT